MGSASTAVKKAQECYKKAWDSSMRKRKHRIRVGDYMFLRCDYTSAAYGPAHKLVPFGHEPYRVRTATDDTCVLYREVETERLSLDKVVFDPIQAPLDRRYASESNLSVHENYCGPSVTEDSAVLMLDARSEHDSSLSAALPPADDGVG